MQHSNKDRTAIVTGGASGIGLAIAKALVGEGYRVAIIGRSEGRLRKVTEQLGPSATWQRADVGERGQVVDAIESIATQFGKIDVVVNNAGLMRAISAEMPLEEAEARWDEVIQTNLKGSFLVAMAAVPHLSRPGGRIINVSSIAAFNGGSPVANLAYAAAKAGLHGLTHGLARELGPHGITVNAIAPGFIANTDVTENWSKERIQSIISETPVGRPGQPEDVATAALYLASPASSFVTGEILNVNGGRLFGR